MRSQQIQINLPFSILFLLLILVSAAWLFQRSAEPIFGASRPVSLAPEGSALAVQEVQGSAISYQGRLLSGGNPVSGQRDFQFRLYDSLENGAAVGPLLDLSAVAVDGGLFTVSLDFGSAAFDGAARYLEVSVRAGADHYTVLAPRQPIQAAPYSLHAANAARAASIADGAVGASSIGEACAYGQVLATDGQSWTCASATTSLGAAQQVDHEVYIGGTLAPAVRADLPTVLAQTGVIVYTDGMGNKIKVPGEHTVAPYYLYCPDSCPTLDNWYTDVRNGSVNRAAVSIRLYGDKGAVTARYDFGDCWPSAFALQLSQDGSAAQPRFEMACDAIELNP